MNFSVIDFEAHDNNRLYAVGFYDGHNVKIKINTSIFNKKITENQRVRHNNRLISVLFDYLRPNTINYAHFGGGYDFLFIMDFVKENNLEIKKSIVARGKILLFSVVYNNNIYNFKDSYFLFPLSLKKLSNDLDLKTKKHDNYNYESEINNKNITEYLAADLKSLYEILTKFPDLIQKNTIANYSVSEFLKYYNKKFQKIREPDINLHNYIRNHFYTGARTEIFKPYGENLNYYDVNSLYPYVMSKYQYPLLNQKPKIVNSENYDRTYNTIGLYTIRSEIEHKKIPLLPYKDSELGLIFPIGQFITTATNAEIQKAIKIGYKIKVLNGIEYRKSDFIFRDYVLKNYKIKQNAKNPSERFIAKLILNSLYGKFGQEAYTQKDILTNNGIKTINVYPLPYKFLHSEIASLITANARLELYRLFEKAGYDNIYYCDTDSIITNKKLKESKELGGLKKEKHIKKFVALSQKIYAYLDDENKEYIVAKGFENTKDFRFKDFLNAYKTKDYSFLKSKNTIGIYGIKQYKIRHFETFTESKIKTIELKKNYTKRTIYKNKTKPHIIK